jgi:hypothetical protein
MKNIIRKPEHSILELFKEFSQQTPDEQQERLNRFDELLLEQPPKDTEFFAGLRENLMELQRVSQT